MESICELFLLNNNCEQQLDDSVNIHELSFDDENTRIARIDNPIYVSTSWYFETFTESCGDSGVYVKNRLNHEEYVCYVLRDINQKQYCVADFPFNVYQMETNAYPDVIYHIIVGVIQDVVLRRVWTPSNGFPVFKQTMLPIVHVMNQYYVELETDFPVSGSGYPEYMFDVYHNRWQKISEERVCLHVVSGAYVFVMYDNDTRGVVTDYNDTHRMITKTLGGEQSICGEWQQYCLSNDIRVSMFDLKPLSYHQSDWPLHVLLLVIFVPVGFVLMTYIMSYVVSCWSRSIRRE